MELTKLQNKIQKSSQFISKICLLVQAFTIFAIANAVISTVNCLVPGFFPTSESAATLLEQYREAKPAVFLITMLLTLFSGLISFYTFRLLRTIFKQTSIDYTPFKEEHIKKLKKIIKLAFTGFVIDLIAGFLMASSLNMPNNWVGAGVSNGLWIMVVYCFVYLFEYGYELQKEADETL